MNEILEENPEAETSEFSANQIAFLAAYGETGVIQRAADAVEVHRSAHFRWMNENDQYREAFENAREEAIDMLESEARRRAIEGTRSYQFFKGHPILNPNWKEGDPEDQRYYFETNYSDHLLTTLLKANRPEKFKDRVATEITGQASVDMQMRQMMVHDEELSAMSCDLLEKMSEKIDQNNAPSDTQSDGEALSLSDSTTE